MAEAVTWRRHHIDETGLQKAVRASALHRGFNKPVGCLCASKTEVVRRFKLLESPFYH